VAGQLMMLRSISRPNDSQNLAGLKHHFRLSVPLLDMKKEDKYIFDSISLEKECYHLSALFMASNNIQNIQGKKPKSQFKIFSIYESQEIKKLLISISIQLRMIDDLMKDYGRRNYIPSKKIGTIKYYGKTNSKKMSIRDACNKVIHAKLLTIVPHKARVILKGTESNEDEWSANISVIAYIESALDLIKSYDEDWDVSAYK